AFANRLGMVMRFLAFEAALSSSRMRSLDAGVVLAVTAMISPETLSWMALESVVLASARTDVSVARFLALEAAASSMRIRSEPVGEAFRVTAAISPDTLSWIASGSVVAGGLI